MIRKFKASRPGYVRVVFELPACLWADRIYLTGDFNNWDQTATPMRQDHDGVWRAEVELPAGQSYEFRYLIDGQWRTDFHADGFTTNNYGTQNSVVRAELPEEELTVLHNGLVHELNETLSLPEKVAPHQPGSRRYSLAA